MFLETFLPLKKVNSEIEEGCGYVRQRGKQKNKAKTKKQRAKYVRVSTAAQQRCTNR